MKKIFQILFIATIGGLIMMSCGDDDGGGTTSPDPTITVTPSTATQGKTGVVRFNVTVSGGTGATVTSVVANDGTSDYTIPATGGEFAYTVPASATVGNDITLTFTVTNDGAKTAMADATITVGRFTVINDADLIGGGTYSLDASIEYLFDGLVYLESGGTLNIPAGTVIRFAADPTGADNTSALIITRDATINATGGPTNPVIFTAESDEFDGALGAGDVTLWGGLILLGNATQSVDGSSIGQIEGIDPGEPRGEYGGNDDADNSGTLTYVSIRHSGVALDGTSGNEIQGLTMGAVGSGTTINYIEIFASFDDGIEFFGGTVKINHAVIAFAQDDSFDWDQGYRGGGQYWFAIQNDVSGHGGEWDGAIPDGAALYSNPTVFNATFIGPGSGSAITNTALLMRDATGGTVANSIIVDYSAKGIEVEDREASVGTDSYSRIGNDLNIMANTWWVAGGTDAAGIINITGDAEDVAGTTLIAHLDGNDNVYDTDPMLAGIDRTQGANGLDPRPAAATAGQTLVTPPAGFDNVSYHGAFDPAGSNWLKGWTALDEKGYLAP